MRCDAEQRSMLYIGDVPFRQLDARSWDTVRRLEDMDRFKVSAQVLSPMPELLSYWLPAQDSAILCDHANAQIAEMAACSSGRFHGLGMVPIQDVKNVYANLRRIKHDFGLLGVEIGSNINGKVLGDPSFEDFFAAAENLELAVFVHALHPLIGAAVRMKPQEMALVGFPLDVGLAICSLILNGTLERHPRLRIGFSHGGGAIGSIIGRLDEGWTKTEGFGGTLKTKPSQQIRSVFFDSNVYDSKYLIHLEKNISPGNIFLGTDYPYTIMQENPLEFIKSTGLENRAIDSIHYQAARQFLNI